MNCEDEFGTFYKIKYHILRIDRQVEYHLSKKNDRYLYYKFINNDLVYITNEFRSNHMVKNIYYIMQNIEKLKEGKIKKYRISTQLELIILCDYLKTNNILHRIKIESARFKCIINKNLSYDEYKEKCNAYFDKNGLDYEHNKILDCYELYIQVYKGFVNLYQNYSHVERPKFGVYIYPYLNIKST